MNETAARPNKRALLIGINKYPKLPSYSQLRGCINDVEAMKHLLLGTFHFPAENINVLLDEEATERAIRDALNELVAVCDEGDIVVFHYSGHGSQMAARGVKPRGYDESIMPSDSGRRNPAFPVQEDPRDIRDTEIQEWLARLTHKTRHVTLIFDSCHSGSITRLGTTTEGEGTRLRWVEPDPLPGAASPPPTRVVREAVGSGWLEVSDKYVLLAACAADQGAYEMDHVSDGKQLRHGAFTFHLIQEISNAPAKSTYLDIWERVAISVNSKFGRQTPQLEGTRDRLIFDVEDFAPMLYLLVTGREGADVRLAGGAVYGLTVGSRWEVYVAGTKQTTESKEGQLGALEITEVGAVTSKAKVIEEKYPEAVTANARAVEVLHVDDETRLRLWLAPAPTGFERAVEELRLVLEQSGLLKVTDSAAGAQAVISISVAGGGRREPGAPRDGLLNGARWEVSDHSQALLMRPCEVGVHGNSLAVRENLEIAWRFQKVLGLSNEKSALNGKIDFALLKVDSDGRWREVARDEVPTYREGEHIGFRVANRTGSVIHVSVLDLGLSKRISVLYPPSSASEEIAPRRAVGESGVEQGGGGELAVGKGSSGRIELSFPDNLDFLTEPPEGGRARGTEYFKLVVTTRRHDLSFLSQPGLRGEPGAGLEHPLERLLYLATTGGRKREAQLKSEPGDEWLTIERAFKLERNN